MAFIDLSGSSTDSFVDLSNAPPVKPNDDGDFVRSVKNYIPQLNEMLGAAQTLGGEAARRAGLDDIGGSLIKSGLSRMQSAKTQTVSKPTDELTGAWEQGGLGSVLTDWLPYQAGQAVGNVVESLGTAFVGAGVGAAIGGPTPAAAVTGATGFMAGLLTKALAKKTIIEAAEGAAKKSVIDVAEDIAKEKGKDAAVSYLKTESGKLVGLNAALAAQAAFHGTGEVGSRVIQEAQNAGLPLDQIDMGRFAASAAGHAALEFIGDKVLVGAFGDSAFRSAKGGILGFAESAAKTGVKTGLYETPVEIGQTTFERAGAGLDLTSAEAQKEYINAGAAGFGMGAISGGAGGGFHHLTSTVSAPREVLEAPSIEQAAINAEAALQDNGAADASMQEVLSAADALTTGLKPMLTDPTQTALAGEAAQTDMTVPPVTTPGQPTLRPDELYSQRTGGLDTALPIIGQEQAPVVARPIEGLIPRPVHPADPTLVVPAELPPAGRGQAQIVRQQMNAPALAQETAQQELAPAPVVTPGAPQTRPAESLAQPVTQQQLTQEEGSKTPVVTLSRNTTGTYIASVTPEGAANIGGIREVLKQNGLKPAAIKDAGGGMDIRLLKSAPEAAVQAAIDQINTRFSVARMGEPDTTFTDLEEAPNADQTDQAEQGEQEASPPVAVRTVTGAHDTAIASLLGVAPDVQVAQVTDLNSLPTATEVAGRRKEGEPVKRMNRWTAQAIKQITGMLGRDVVFYEASHGTAEGINDDGKTLYVNVDSGVDALAVAGHEFTHSLQSTDKALYDKAHAATKALLAANPERAQAYRNQFASKKGKEYTDDQLAHELLADIGGNEWRDGSYFHDLFARIQEMHPTEARSLITRLRDAIVAFINKLIKATPKSGFNHGFTRAELIGIRENLIQAAANSFVRAERVRMGLDAQTEQKYTGTDAKAYRERLAQESPQRWDETTGKTETVDEVQESDKGFTFTDSTTGETLEFPTRQQAQTAMDLQKRNVQFSRNRVDESIKDTDQSGIVIGAKPGAFGWTPQANTTLWQKTKTGEAFGPLNDGDMPPPFGGPTQATPNQARIGELYAKILNTKAVATLLNDVLEAHKLKPIVRLTIVQTQGSWLGRPERSFRITGMDSFDQSDVLSKFFGFGTAQDMAIVVEPVANPNDDTDVNPGIALGDGRKFDEARMKGIIQAAQAEGIDYTLASDKYSVQFVYGTWLPFNEAEFKAKVGRIAAATKMKQQGYNARGKANFSKDYHNVTSTIRSVVQGSGNSNAAGRPSNLFTRTVDHVLVPYAKAVGAEGYRFSPDLFGERFDLNAAEVEYIRAALRPKDGRALSTAHVVSQFELDARPDKKLKPGEELILPNKTSGTEKRPVSNNSDIHWALQNRTALTGMIEPGDYSPEAHKVIAQAIEDEIAFHVSRSEGKSAIGWYDAALKAAKKIYHQVFPELDTNPDREMLFDALLGIASQGNDVHSNSIFAGRMYYLITRENMSISQAVAALTGTFGGNSGQIENNFLKLEQLLKVNDYARLRFVLNSQKTVGEWNAQLRWDKSLHFNGEPIQMTGKKDQIIRGWMMFGPKIGSFINNLHGDYSTLTADLWFSRTWNRILGFSFLHTPTQEAPKYQSFKNALLAEFTRTTEPKKVAKNGKVTEWEHGHDLPKNLSESDFDRLIADPDEMLNMATVLEELFSTGYGFNGERGAGYSTKSDLRRAAKAWIEHRDNVVEIPRTDSEREFQQEVMETAQKLMKKRHGVSITIADMQAAMWFHEKELFGKFGVTDAKSVPADYVDAAEKFMKSYNDGDLFYVNKPKPKYVYGTKGSYSANAPDTGPQYSEARVDASSRGPVRNGDERVSYGEQQEHAVSVEGLHYSDSKRAELDSSKYGRGMAGAERARLDRWSSTPEQKQRIHFYVNEGAGTQAETGVGYHAHVVKLNNLYPLPADPLNFRNKAREKYPDPADQFNQLEQSAMQAGFDGVYIKGAQGTQGVAVLLGKHVVPVDYLGMGKQETTVADDTTLDQHDWRAGHLPEGDPSIRFSPPRISPRVKSWAQAVKDGKAEREAPSALLILKPNKLLNSVGIFRPIAISYDHAIHAFKHAEITTNDIAALPDLLERPRAVLKNLTGEGWRFIADARTPNGDPLMVVLSNTGTSKTTKVTEVNTLFGKDQSASLIADALLNGDVMYLRKGEDARVRRLIDVAPQPFEELKSESLLPTPQERSSAPPTSLISEREVTVRSDNGDVKFMLPTDAAQRLRGKQFSLPRKDWYYSELATAFDKMPAKVKTGNDAATWIQANRGNLGVKKEELEWSGVTDFLKLQKTVTPEQIKAFLSTNDVQVRTVTLGEIQPVTDEDIVDGARIGDYGVVINEDGYFAFDEYNEQVAGRHSAWDLADWFNEETEKNPRAKFGPGDQPTLSLPGGSNYREMLITLPLKPNEYIKFKSQHFDQPNILAHLRVNDRTDVDGKKVLFLEEIQSDWGQKGKKEGFADASEKNKARIKALLSEHETLRLKIEAENRQPNEQETAEFARINAEDSRLRQAVTSASNGGVPSAPFVQDTKAWTALALKRAIAYAAENGYQAMAWTNGEQQAERYDLSKQVSSVKATGLPNGKFFVEVDSLNGDPIFTGDLSAGEIEDQVGKDLAVKIAEQKAGEFKEYSGLDLKVGGEGMKAYYDRIVPQVANDVLRKIGGEKVGTVEIGLHQNKEKAFAAGDARQFHDMSEKTWDRLTSAEQNRLIDEYWAQDGSQQPGFQITDKMREQVATKGLPLFSHPRVLGDTLSWQEFGQYLETIPAKDAFGKIDAKEKRHWAAAGESWKLIAVDPVTLEPVSVLVNVKQPIIVGPDGDVIDGRHRLVRAINNDDKAIAAWVASTQPLFSLARVDTNSPEFKKLSSLLGSSGMPRDVPANLYKSLVDGLKADAHSLGNLLESSAFLAKGYRGLDIPSKRMVVEHVLGMTQNNEVLGRVIGSVPVDVMNLLAGGQRSPQGFLRDKAMLEDVLAVNGKPSISLGVNKSSAIGTLLESITRNATEVASGLTNGTLESGATNNAGSGNTALSGHSNPPSSTGLVHHKPVDTKSQAFTDWFGDSKVVDGSGKPLVVYHGTRNDISTFAPGKHSKEGLIFLSTSPSFASDWVTHIGRPHDEKYRTPTWTESDKANQKAYFAKYSNTFTPEERSAYLKTAPETQDFIRKISDATVYPVYIKAANIFDPRQDYAKIETFLNKTFANKPDILKLIAKGEHKRGNWIVYERPEITAELKRQGYDALWLAERSHASAEHETLAVFSPTQIKSAISNTGEFSGTNPDIRYSTQRIIGDSGRARTPEQLAMFKATGRTLTQLNPAEKVKQIWANAKASWAQNVFDQFAPIDKLSHAAYRLMRLSKGASGAFEAFMRYGKLHLEADGTYNSKNDGGVMTDVFFPLGKETTDFLYWIAGHRAERLAAEGKERLFTPEHIKAAKSLSDGTTDFDYVMRDGSTTRDRTKIYADSLIKFNEFNKNLLDMAEQSGLIDKASRHLWEHEFYVPFFRVMDENDGGVRGMNIKKGVIRQKAFQKLKGGTEGLNDLLSNTLMNWAHLIDASAKNRAAQATIEAAENVGAATSAPHWANHKGAVWFMKDGKQQWYKIEDEAMLTAINGLDYVGLRGPMWDVLTKPKHWLTMGVTASPFFKVRNLIRDSVQAVGASGLSYNVPGNLIKGYHLTNHANDEYVSALAGGALIRFGTMLEGNEAARTRRLIDLGADPATILDSNSKIWDFGEKMLTAYNELGNRGEEINRMSLYDQLVKQGVSHGEAALQARDLMDFSMSGASDAVRTLAQIVPFFNARLQGIYKLGKAAKTDPAKLAIVTMSVAMASLALLAAYHDDDDWKKRANWDRDNYWWFKIGEEVFRIPKPFELGSIGTLAERSAELMYDKEMTGKKFYEVTKQILAGQLAMNPVPQAVKPIVDIYANKDSFTGRPIETMGMERLDPEYRFTSRTSMPARAISTAIGGALSPVQVDHLVRGYFAWLGATSVATADIMVRNATDQPTKPTMDYWKFATGGMVSDLSSEQSRYVSEMYDQAKEIEQAHGTWNALRKEGKTAEAQEFMADNMDKLRKYSQVESVKRTEAKLNERIRIIERSKMDPDDKRDRIVLIQKQKDQIARRISPGL